MTTSLLLLDMDGTVRETVSGATFINSPEDQRIIPEAAAALERFASIGTTIVGVSNQAGVAAGYKTIGECIDEQIRTMELAPQIRAIFFCPDSDGSRCFYVKPSGTILTLDRATIPALHGRSFRKPSCGMLLAAMGMFQATPDDTAMVGDRDEDRTAAISAGCDFLPHEAWWHSYPVGTEPKEEAA